MSTLCECPNPAELESPVDFTCPENFDQIQKILAYRKAAKAALGWFADEAALLVEANWDALLAQTGDDKLIITPYLNNVVIPMSEEQTEGGNDNTTINGIETYLGESFTKVTGELRGAPSEVSRAMQKVGCETTSDIGETNVESFYIARGNLLIYSVPNGGTVPEGFSIYNLRVGDVGSEGFNAKNKMPISWSKAPGWSSYFKVVKLPFDLLSKVNP
jgi:hypothetical protein